MSLSSPDMPQAPMSGLNRDLRKPGLIGLVGFAIMIGVLGLWAATTVIGGAVIASGQAVVQGDAKVVQSLDGGMVETILIENGDQVGAGDVLVRLDPTLLQVNLSSARSRLAAALALQERLQAEQLRLPSLEFTYDTLPFDRPDTTAHEASQREIFLARRAVLDGARAQLAEVFVQSETRRRGLEGQITATSDQIALIEQDLENMRTLTQQGLARQSQMSELQRAQSELLGRLATLESELAQLDNNRRESELETLQRERSFMETVVTELRDATAQVEELTLEIITRSAQLDRVEIRAPVAGVVHEMQITTQGGVLAPGGTILEIIPSGNSMEFTLRVDPHSIDQVWQGQPAKVTLAAFDPQSTPQLTAAVTQISPDVVRDPATGQSYYRVGLEVPREELARLGEVDLLPGMPIEAFLETGDRSVLAYLMQPLSSHLRRAFRE